VRKGTAAIFFILQWYIWSLLGKSLFVATYLWVWHPSLITLTSSCGTNSEWRYFQFHVTV
jgi:hypothetical protein